MMDNKEFSSMVRKAVEEVLNENDKKARIEKAEKLVTEAENTISKLTDLVNDKSEEITTLTSKVEELETANTASKDKGSELETKVAELEQSLEEASRKASDVEKEKDELANKLVEIEKDKILVERINELAEAKVASKGDSLEAQKVRVREMSAEDFESYKNDLVSVRKELEESVKLELADNKDKADVAPPVINKETAAAAQVNAEEGPTARERYRKLGESLAAKMRGK